MRTGLLAIIAVAATTACSEAATEPTAVQTEALIASAAEWSPADLTRDLDVDDATRQEIERGIESLHAAMLDLHERYQAAERLDGAARAEYAAALQTDVEALHGRHRALWNSLDEDVRDALAAQFHARMADHDGPMKSLHERMRRLHGGGH